MSSKRSSSSARLFTPTIRRSIWLCEQKRRLEDGKVIRYDNHVDKFDIVIPPGDEIFAEVRILPNLGGFMIRVEASVIEVSPIGNPPLVSAGWAHFDWLAANNPYGEWVNAFSNLWFGLYFRSELVPVSPRWTAPSLRGEI